MSNPPVILWDFDGTLGYRPGMWSQALLDVLLEHDPASAITLEEVRPFMREGFPWHQPHIPHVEVTTPEQWWAEIETILIHGYIGTGCSLELASQLAPLAHQRYLDASQWFLFEDVIPALEALSSQGWEHVILSNHVPELSAIADAVGLTPHMRMIVSSALRGYEKPHPQAFLQVLELLGYPEIIWMIGDNIEADILGAQAVGIPAILVRKEDTRATYAYPDLALIADFLSQKRRFTLNDGKKNRIVW
jgi:putative hydrolase of the HAD superfamily